MKWYQQCEKYSGEYIDIRRSVALASFTHSSAQLSNICDLCVYLRMCSNFINNILNGNMLSENFFFLIIFALYCCFNNCYSLLRSGCMFFVCACSSYSFRDLIWFVCDVYSFFFSFSFRYVFIICWIFIAQSQQDFGVRWVERANCTTMALNRTFIQWF